jgi:hypothetical protein
VAFDILDGVTRRLRVNGVSMISPDAVASWLDDHGGRFDDVAALGSELKADYVIHIELTKFRCKEENSPHLLRGRSEGHVRAYKLEGTGASKQAMEVMSSDFVAVYPAGNPIAADRRSETNFSQEYIGRVCLQLAQMFYDHPMAEEIP